MQVQDVPKQLLAGEPYCAPDNVVTVETTINLLRTLQTCNSDNLQETPSYCKSPSPGGSTVNER